MKKTILTLLVLCCTASIVNAQFGGLGKKLKEKAKTAVTQKKNEVQAEAKQEIKQKANQVASNLEPYEKKFLTMMFTMLLFSTIKYQQYAKKTIDSAITAR